VKVDAKIIENVKRASLLMEKQKPIKQKCSIQLEEDEKKEEAFRKESRFGKDLKSKVAQLEKEIRDINHESYL
jgi:hypothetical protein